jgi:hypothetical protein
MASMGESTKSLFKDWLAAYEIQLQRIAMRDDVQQPNPAGRQPPDQTASSTQPDQDT